MRVPVGDLVFDVDVTGLPDAPVVVLLHGFPQSKHCWRLLIPHLRGFRVVAPDQRGYSPDARPTDVESYRVPRLTQDVLDLLDALEVDEAHVVGHDWGAAVAWQVGARHPSRVRTLTTLSTSHPKAFSEALRTDEDQRQKSLYMKEFAQPGYAEVLLADDAVRLRDIFGAFPGPVDVEHMVARAQQPGALDAWLRWYAGQRRVDVVDTPDVSVPTLHVWSDRDLALGRVAAEGTAQCVTGPYRFEVLEGISHWVPEEAPDQLAPILLEHLRA